MYRKSSETIALQPQLVGDNETRFGNRTNIGLRNRNCFAQEWIVKDELNFRTFMSEILSTCFKLGFSWSILATCVGIQPVGSVLGVQ